MKLQLCVARVFTDIRGGRGELSDIDEHVRLALAWLGRAQDSQGSGVSLRYSLIDGWSAAYPETTGYIIPTFIDLAVSMNDNELYRRATAMADWELSIQEKDGSFRGGAVDSGYDSFVFDTGQIVFGFIAAYKATKQTKYLDAAVRAGNWLVAVQDAAGMWSRFTFHSIPHVYYTRVAWALAELGNVTHESAFVQAADRNVRWAVAQQRSNGWFDMAGFTERGHLTPFTHTIAYTIEGVLETGVCLGRDDYVAAARRAADSMCGVIRDDGYLAGELDSGWQPRARYSCLTGNAQLSIILLRLYEIYRDTRYLQAAKSLNTFLRRHQDRGSASEVRGAVAGSWPIWGRYQRFAYPNWAAKFFIDALLLERKLVADMDRRPASPGAAAIAGAPAP
jgi:hypothetical protein